MKLRINSMLRNLVLATLCSMAAVACGGNNKNELQMVESLKGSWENGCQNNGINSPFTRYRYEVVEDAFDLIVTRYSDPQCASADYQVVYGGTITDRDTQALTRNIGSAAASIDVRFDSVSLTALSPEQVSINQASALCGLTDWQIEVSYSVSGCAAVPLSNVPYDEYNVYSVSAVTDMPGATHAIHFGAMSGSTTEERPGEVDLGNPFYGSLLQSF